MLDRGIRVLQRSVGQWWIRAATARLRHVHGARAPAARGTRSGASSSSRTTARSSTSTSRRRSSWRSGLPHRILFPVRSTFFYDHPLGPAGQRRDELLRDVPAHLPRPQARGAQPGEPRRDGGAPSPRRVLRRASTPRARARRTTTRTRSCPRRAASGASSTRRACPVVPVFVNGLLQRPRQAGGRGPRRATATRFTSSSARPSTSAACSTAPGGPRDLQAHRRPVPRGHRRSSGQEEKAIRAPAALSRGAVDAAEQAGATDHRRREAVPRPRPRRARPRARASRTAPASTRSRRSTRTTRSTSARASRSSRRRRSRWKNIVVENLWFLSGETHIGLLKKHGCKFWDPWADETGSVPSAYGNFWRHFPVHDGATGARRVQRPDPRGSSTRSKRNPMSRRLVVTAWAPGNAQTSKLPPCHLLFMFNVQLDAQRRPAPLPAPHAAERRRGARRAVQHRRATRFLLELFSRFTGIRAGHLRAHADRRARLHGEGRRLDGRVRPRPGPPRSSSSAQPRALPRLTIDPAIRSLDDLRPLLEADTETVMQHFVLTGTTRTRRSRSRSRSDGCAARMICRGLARAGHRRRRDDPVAPPGRLRRFKRLTLGTTVVMGRATCESIGAARCPGGATSSSRARAVDAPGVECVAQHRRGARARRRRTDVGSSAARASTRTRWRTCDVIDVTYVPDHVDAADAVRAPPIDERVFEPGRARRSTRTTRASRGVCTRDGASDVRRTALVRPA